MTNNKRYTKTHNEYNDKLVDLETSKIINGYFNVYQVECFVYTNDNNDIRDEWTGLIPEGSEFFCYRPTQTGLKKWFRDEHNIQIYVKPLPDKTWSVYVDQWGHHLLNKYIIVDDYEEGLELGLQHAAKYIVHD